MSVTGVKAAKAQVITSDFEIRPRRPRNYLDKVLHGRVHWVSADRSQALAFFYERENPDMTDGHPDGFLGDAWIRGRPGEIQLNPGDRYDGIVSTGISFRRMASELLWHELHMIPADRDRHAEKFGITGSRRVEWETRLRQERIRWAIRLEPGDVQ
jgi:hypothetical protein